MLLVNAVFQIARELFIDSHLIRIATCNPEGPKTGFRSRDQAYEPDGKSMQQQPPTTKHQTAPAPLGRVSLKALREQRDYLKQKHHTARMFLTVS